MYAYKIKFCWRDVPKNTGCKIKQHLCEQNIKTHNKLCSRWNSAWFLYLSIQVKLQLYYDFVREFLNWVIGKLEKNIIDWQWLLTSCNSPQSVILKHHPSSIYLLLFLRKGIHTKNAENFWIAEWSIKSLWQSLTNR